jgi:hypothetical protein
LLYLLVFRVLAKERRSIFVGKQYNITARKIVNAKGGFISSLEVIGNRKLSAEQYFPSIFQSKLMLEDGAIEVDCKQVKTGL